MATQHAPARCTPDAAAQLQPIPYACGAQRALLPSRQTSSDAHHRLMPPPPALRHTIGIRIITIHGPWSAAASRHLVNVNKLTLWAQSLVLRQFRASHVALAFWTQTESYTSKLQGHHIWFKFGDSKYNRLTIPGQNDVNETKTVIPTTEETVRETTTNSNNASQK